MSCVVEGFKVGMNDCTIVASDCNGNDEGGIHVSICRCIGLWREFVEAYAIDCWKIICFQKESFFVKQKIHISYEFNCSLKNKKVLFVIIKFLLMCENFLISYLSKINCLFGVFSWAKQSCFSCSLTFKSRLLGSERT